jgi:EAL domain-containing protein (putative c-di-GMP-specific phosphodiesterase class I)
VELGQGYLFGKPVSADEFEAHWLVPTLDKGRS